MTGRLRGAAAALVAVIALGGCGFKGAYSLPLPGGSAGGDNYKVTVVFRDVQDLVPMSAVRVDDVAVGDVVSIDPHVQPDGTVLAYVGLRIKKGVTLPENATATLEQTTLLGEKYVALAPPTAATPAGTLHDGDTIDAARTSNLPDVEQLFGVLSAVLNGGDLQDLQTINFEVTKALSGREQDIQSALAQLDRFVAGLDSQRNEITRALDQLNRFSGELARQRDTVATALQDLGPGLKVLADERQQFTALLTDLSRFGRVATHIITASRQQTVEGLRRLQPILGHLRAAGTNLPRSLELLITYPFPRNIDKAIPGDYNGLYLSFNADPVFCAMVPPPLPVSCGSSNAAAGRTGSSGHAASGQPATPPVLPPLQTAQRVLERVLGAAVLGGSK